MSLEKILLLGKSGQIGSELLRSCGRLAQIVAIGREDLDLNNLEEVKELLRFSKPDLILNAAAYTAVDLAEKERRAATRLNTELPALLAQYCAQQRSAIIHYSTDYVYDGIPGSPYTEDKKPAPLNFYGVSKLAGDEAIQESGAPHLIFRTCWVYSKRGQNFMCAIFRKWSSGETIRVVNDQVGSPTSAGLIADVTAQVIAIIGSARHEPFSDNLAEFSGLYHLAASGQASWFDFAAAFLPANAIRSGRLVPISTSDYSATARRPAFSVLSTHKLRHTFGLQLPSWPDCLRNVLKEL